MRGIPLGAVLFTVAALLSGCEMAAGYLATDFGLSTNPEEVEVVRGEVREVELHVSRILPIDVSPFPVTMTLHRAPAGVTLAEGDSLQIPSGVDREVVTLQVAEETPTGTHDVVFRGTNGLRTKDVTLTLVVSDP